MFSGKRKKSFSSRRRRKKKKKMPTRRGAAWRRGKAPANAFNRIRDRELGFARVKPVFTAIPARLAVGHRLTTFTPTFFIQIDCKQQTFFF